MLGGWFEQAYSTAAPIFIARRETLKSLRTNNMKNFIIIFVAAFAFFASSTAAQTPTVPPTEEASIRATALDYIEGWYEGNPERMERALHPELAKRIVRTGPQGQNRLDQMSAMSLVMGTRRGGGKQTPKEKQQKDVTVLDVYENAASV